jgi:hypothetical protein
MAVIAEAAVLTQEAEQLSMESGQETHWDLVGFAAPRSHGSLPTQWPETHPAARILRLVSVSQRKKFVIVVPASERIQSSCCPLSTPGDFQSCDSHH